MKKFSIILTILVSLSASLSSCKKQCKDPSNPECPNYDHCFGKSDVKADFKILGQISAWGLNKDGYLTVDASIVSSGSTLIFKSKDPSFKSYEWSVGTDIRRWKENSFSLTFGQLDGQKIPVTLIVEGAPNKNCTNKSDWKDTLTKYVHFIPYGDFAIFGEYTGSLTSNTSETFSVRIVPSANNPQNIKQYISGLPFRHKEQIETFFDTTIELKGSANNIVTFSNDYYNSPRGLATLDLETNEITIEYNRIEPYPPAPGGSTETWPRKTYIFKGKKIK